MIRRHTFFNNKTVVMFRLRTAAVYTEQFRMSREIKKYFLLSGSTEFTIE